MSKANDKALLVLGIAAGALQQAYEQKAIGKVSLIKQAKDDYEYLRYEIIHPWPGREKGVKRVLKWLQQWVVAASDLKTDLRLVVTVKTGILALDELYDRTNNLKKLYNINTAREMLLNLDAHLDPDGVNFNAMDEAKRMLDKLEEIMK